MRRYTAPGTYNYTWQEMNNLRRWMRAQERESFVENSLGVTSLLVIKCGIWTKVQVCA